MASSRFLQCNLGPLGCHWSIRSSSGDQSACLAQSDVWLEAGVWLGSSHCRTERDDHRTCCARPSGWEGSVLPQQSGRQPVSVATRHPVLAYIHTWVLHGWDPARGPGLVGRTLSLRCLALTTTCCRQCPAFNGCRGDRRI